MQIKLLEEPFPFAGSGVPRTAGIHLTPILHGLDKLINNKQYSGGEWDLEMCAEIGFTWERAMEIALKDRLGVRPKEITRDGIICSPDGIGFDPLGEVPLVVEELKFWWRSSNKSITDDWYAIMQQKCYCKVINTTVSVMRICYCVGAYWGQGPVYKPLRIEFTEEEINEAWDMVVRNKEIGE